tara:strand:+ start:387 stop:773 length:387 start_codon:yes stop_codon:yes gene_type:complete
VLGSALQSAQHFDEWRPWYSSDFLFLVGTITKKGHHPLLDDDLSLQFHLDNSYIIPPVVPDTAVSALTVTSPLPATTSDGCDIARSRREPRRRSTARNIAVCTMKATARNPAYNAISIVIKFIILTFI